MNKIFFLCLLFMGCSFNNKAHEHLVGLCIEGKRINIFYMDSFYIIKSLQSTYVNDTLVLDVKISIGESHTGYYVDIDRDISYVQVGKKVYNIHDIQDCSL